MKKTLDKLQIIFKNSTLESSHVRVFNPSMSMINDQIMSVVMNKGKIPIVLDTDLDYLYR